MKPWVGSTCLLACGVTSFVAPNLMWNFKDSSRSRQARMRRWSTSSENHTVSECEILRCLLTSTLILMMVDYTKNMLVRQGSRDENSSTDPNHKVPSVLDLEQLLGSFNLSSLPEMTSDAEGSRQHDLDEVRLEIRILQ